MPCFGDGRERQGHGRYTESTLLCRKLVLGVCASDPNRAVWPEAMVGLSGYPSELRRVRYLGLNLNILLLVVNGAHHDFSVLSYFFT